MTHPVYSDDPNEESRLLSIRDSNDRLRLIGESRAKLGRVQPKFSDTELHWILNDLRRHSYAIANMQPQEYAVVIEELARLCLSQREILQRGTKEQVYGR